jgi:hypothetical protein
MTVARFLAALIAILLVSGMPALTANSNSAPGLLLVANKGEHTLGLVDPNAER